MPLAFSDLVKPTDPTVFFWEHFERSPHLSKGERSRFHPLLSPATWQQAVQASRQVTASCTDAHGLQHSVAISGDEVSSRFQAEPICADVTHWDRVAAFFGRFRADLNLTGGPCLAELYASAPGEGFEIHSDAFDVFVLQIAGRKRWRVSPPHRPARPGVRMDR